MLAISIQKLSKVILFFVSFAAGGLLGDSFFHLLPEASRLKGFDGWVSFWVLSGIILFFVLEKFISWRHCHLPTSSDHPHPLGIMNLVGDALHNFTDGVILAATFIIDPSLGLATTLAIVFHEIPQEIGDFGILIHAGFSVKKALFYNFLTALAAFGGALLILIFGKNLEVIRSLVPFTAGGFIYIASSDLIPELKKEVGFGKSAFQLLGVILGITVMILLGLKE